MSPIPAADECVDIVRIDHFRGFQSFWQVPSGETTAATAMGRMSGDAFCHTLEHELFTSRLGRDLGLVTPEVEKRRATSTFRDEGPSFASTRREPRTRICHSTSHRTASATQDARQRYNRRVDTLDSAGKRRGLDYLGAADGKEIHWSMIRLAMSSIAESVVVPLQDVLGLVRMLE